MTTDNSTQSNFKNHNCSKTLIIKIRVLPLLIALCFIFISFPTQGSNFYNKVMERVNLEINAIISADCYNSNTDFFTKKDNLWNENTAIMGCESVNQLTSNGATLGQSGISPPILLVPTCLGCTVSNTANLLDADTTNAATVSIPVGLAGYAYLSVRFGQTFPEGTRAGFFADVNGGLAGVLNGITLISYNNNAPVETIAGGDLLNLLGIGGPEKLQGIFCQPFDELRIQFGSLVGALANYQVFYAFVDENCQFPVQCGLAVAEPEICDDGIDNDGDGDLDNEDLDCAVVDSDGDGIDDAIEDGAPNGGDGNSDGILDKNQGTVASLPRIDGHYVTAQVLGTCTNIDFIANISEADLSEESVVYDFPYGLMDLRLNCLLPGQLANVTYFWHGVTSLVGTVYIKQGAVVPDDLVQDYFPYASILGDTILGSTNVPTSEILLVDGVIGDDTGIDGKIIDPSGPAVVSANLDSDMDGVVDADDLDDDNDGVLDIEEGLFDISYHLNQVSALPPDAFISGGGVIPDGSPGLRLADATNTYFLDLYQGVNSSAGAPFSFNTMTGEISSNTANVSGGASGEIVEIVYTTLNSPEDWMLTSVQILNVQSLSSGISSSVVRDAYAWNKLGTWTPLGTGGNSSPAGAVVSVDLMAGDRVGDFVIEDPDGNNEINNIGTFNQVTSVEPVVSDVLLNMIGEINGHNVQFDFDVPVVLASLYPFNSGGDDMFWSYFPQLIIKVSSGGADTDGDLVQDHNDLDSDGDGCSDAFEAGATSDKAPNFQFDTSDPNWDTNNNGLADVVEDLPANPGMVNYTVSGDQLDSMIFNCNYFPEITNFNSDSTASLDYAENDITNVIDYEATDQDGDTEVLGLTYSLSGADAGLFSLAPTAGIILWNASPDFENPMDANNDNAYEITVTVTDSAGDTDVQHLTVNVTDVTEGNIRLLCVDNRTDKILIKNFGMTAQAISNYRLCSKNVCTPNSIENDMTVINGNLVLAPGDSVEIAGFALDTIAADLALFLENGSLTDPATLVDFTQWGSAGHGSESVADAKGIWTAGEFMEDLAEWCYNGDGLTENGVNFWDGNDAPTVTTANNTSMTENTPPPTVIFDVNSTDDNEVEGTGFTYSLSGDAVNSPDEAHFSIVPSTGEITVAIAPDFENPTDADADNVYQIEVQVCDSGSACGFQIFNITVLDEDEDGDGFTIYNGDTDDSDPCVPENTASPCCQAQAPIITND